MSDEYMAPVPLAEAPFIIASLKNSLHDLDAVEIIRDDSFCVAFRLRSNSKCDNWPEDARISLLGNSLLLSVDSLKDRESILKLIVDCAQCKGVKLEFVEE